MQQSLSFRRKTLEIYEPIAFSTLHAMHIRPPAWYVQDTKVSKMAVGYFWRWAGLKDLLHLHSLPLCMMQLRVEDRVRFFGWHQIAKIILYQELYAVA